MIWLLAQASITVERIKSEDCASKKRRLECAQHATSVIPRSGSL
jgi:hypothetical protein